MKEVKVQNNDTGEWRSVTMVDMLSRPGWVQVQEKDAGAEPYWVNVAEVHPADQIAIQVETIASQRYEWVPDEDMKT